MAGKVLRATVVTRTAPIPSAKIKIVGGQLTPSMLLKQVKTLPWVKRARIRRGRGGKFLIIKTFPYVVDTKGYAGPGMRHKIPGMKIKIRLINDKFSEGARHRAFHSEYVKLWGRHPHISCRRDVCWGSGSTQLTNAVRRNDIYSLVVTLGFWLINPNYSSAYTKRFSKTDLPVGWINKSTGHRWFRTSRNRV